MSTDALGGVRNVSMRFRPLSGLILMRSCPRRAARRYANRVSERDRGPNKKPAPIIRGGPDLCSRGTTLVYMPAYATFATSLSPLRPRSVQAMPPCALRARNARHCWPNAFDAPPRDNGGLPAGATGVLKLSRSSRVAARRTPHRTRGRLPRCAPHRACTIPGSLSPALRVLVPRDDCV